MNEFLFEIERAREIVKNYDPTDVKSCSDLVNFWNKIVENYYNENKEVVIEVWKIITQDRLANALIVIGEM